MQIIINVEPESSIMMNLDFDPEEFRVKLTRQNRGKESVLQIEENQSESAESKRLELRSCLHCGDEFLPESNNQKYCTPECHHEHYRKKEEITGTSIDEALLEIERTQSERESVPYEFGK